MVFMNLVMGGGGAQDEEDILEGEGEPEYTDEQAAEGEEQADGNGDGNADAQEVVVNVT